MRTSAGASKTSSKCPMCGSKDVESCTIPFPTEGFLTKTSCGSCGFWVGNCVFTHEGKMEYRGFAREGAVPTDMPIDMFREVSTW